MKISSKTIASFGEIKKSPLIIKGLLILLFSTFLIRTFVYITTNRLYNPRVYELLKPLYLYSLILVIALIFILTIYFLYIKKIIDYLIIGSLLILISTILLEFYEFSPCLFKYSNSYVDYPHPVSKILKQSFLCPSYSHNSRLYLLFFAVISFLTFIISISEKKLKKE